MNFLYISKEQPSFRALPIAIGTESVASWHNVRQELQFKMVLKVGHPDSYRGKINVLQT